ncbi:hypothetical protein O1611_g2546 [Lasiodiplodia mahajangana]|uniref:Uncharacterized protein n=1 Tax=Lasiodiplodia mahajangana TaxID=1108764 RepID=A0ACC2JUY7_9PEZI|nr:hypothetical protein O1611_g2546 [Lasiodiplodia mahajangana]
MPGHSFKTKRSHHHRSNEFITLRTYRSAFSRNYICSYAEREENPVSVYNWNSKGYDRHGPHPIYGKLEEHGSKERVRKIDVNRTCSGSKGKEKALFEEIRGDKAVDHLTVDLGEQIDTWLQGRWPSKVVNTGVYENPLLISETSSISTPYTSIFDGGDINHSSSDENENNEVLSTNADLYIPEVGLSLVNSNPALPCEFAAFHGCGQSFELTAVDNWIEHTISHHLKGCLPTRCVCWFCDEPVFDSENGSNRRINFERRMRHISHHILQDRYTIHDIRADYYMLDHLYEHDLVDTTVYNACREYAEIPKPSEVHSFDFISPEAKRQDHLSKIIIIDQAKEDRIRQQPVAHLKEEAVRKGGFNKETQITDALSSSSVSKACLRSRPQRLDSCGDARSKVNIQRHSEVDETSNIGGIDTVAPTSTQTISTLGRRIEHHTSGEAEALYSLISEDHAHSTAIESVTNAHGRGRLKRVKKSANNIGQDPKIIYGPPRNRRQTKIRRSHGRGMTHKAPSSRETLGRRAESGKGRPNLPSMALFQLNLLFSKMTTRFRRLYWPRRPSHLERVSWICRCGQPLYVDVRPAERQQAIEYAQAASGSTSSIAVSGASTSDNSSIQTSNSLLSPTAQLGANVSSVTGPAVAQVQPNSIFTPPVLPKGTKKYLLLCVNTGQFEIKLQQIDLTHTSLDVAMFSLIREKYESMRGPRIKRIFTVPKTIEFIKFELVHRSSTGECVGNYEKNSIPGKLEVANREYTFSPCPPRIGTMPIHPHVFMHSFLNPGDHLGKLALLQLPKKVGRRLQCAPQSRDPSDLPYGWGIYIVEGLNTILVSLLLLGIVGVVTLIVLLWSAIKSDVQGGTGIGQYGLAVMGMIVAICAFSWEPLKGLAR